MSQPFDSRPAEAGPVLAPQDVKAFILAHRELFAGDLDLMAAITPRSYHDGENVTDLQTFVINRLRSDLDTVRAQGQALLETATANLAAQDRVHAAVLKLLEARSFQELIRITQDEAAALIGADAVVICVESPDPGMAQRPPEGIAIMTEGMVDEVLGAGISYQLNNGRRRVPAVYGPKARRIRSEALLRLSFGPDLPEGLLILGSVDAEVFAPDQRGELLCFLARAVERCVMTWLGLAHTS